jgi:hypothetical protein
VPQDPSELARLDAGEPSPVRRVVTVFADRHGTGDWRIEWFDDDGGVLDPLAFMEHPIRPFAGEDVKTIVFLDPSPDSTDGFDVTALASTSRRRFCCAPTRSKCARQSWCDPSGGSPAQVRDGAIPCD